jgi:hypothetical protein
MAVPSMGLTPVVMAIMEAKGIIAKFPWVNLPMTLAVTGFSLIFSTPTCCALFPQVRLNSGMLCGMLLVAGFSHTFYTLMHPALNSSPKLARM